MGRLIPIEVVNNNGTAVCVPSKVTVVRGDEDVILWFSNDGAHEASFKDNPPIFNVKIWKGDKGRPSDQPGVLQGGAPLGSHMASVVLKDAAGNVIAKDGGTSVIVK
jgi:hypothetical protein